MSGERQNTLNKINLYYNDLKKMIKIKKTKRKSEYQKFFKKASTQKKVVNLMIKLKK